MLPDVPWSISHEDYSTSPWQRLSLINCSVFCFTVYSIYQPFTGILFYILQILQSVPKWKKSDGGDVSSLACPSAYAILITMWKYSTQYIAVLSTYYSTYRTVLSILPFLYSISPIRRCLVFPCPGCTSMTPALRQQAFSTAMTCVLLCSAFHGTSSRTESNLLDDALCRASDSAYFVL